MDFTFESIMAFIRANFFYDLRSSVVSICFLIGAFFFFKLLKDNGEKVAKSLKYITLYTTSPNGVIAFNVKEKPSTEVADILDKKYNICVRAGLHCAPLYHKKLGTINQGTVRVSFGYNNEYEDVEKVLIALKEIAKG